MSRKKSAHLGKLLGIDVRVRQIRGRLTQDEFGKLFGVGGSAVSKWEDGKLPDEDTLEKIAKYAEKPLGWLLRGDQTDEGVLNLQEHVPEIYTASPLPPLGFALLVEVEAAVDDYFSKHRLKRKPVQRGRLVAFLYEYCAESKEHPSELLVEKYLILAD